jgi:hypothetical protein
MLCPLSVFNISPQIHDLCCRRRKYDGLYIVVTGYVSMTDEKNIKSVVLIGEHTISRGCKFPGYSREDRRDLVCNNIGEGFND